MLNDYLIMPEKKITFPLVVEPFQEDFKGHLSWANLGNIILRVSSLHAEAHGFGHTYMITHKRGWVLSRLVLELDHLPATNEPYNVTTWVSRIFRQFTDRNYAITGPDGQVYGHGASIWALIDYETRQPVNLETLPEGGFHSAMLDETPPIAPFGRARCKSTEPAATRDCRYSDLDINGHVNSIRYIDMTLDLFSAEWHKAHTVKRIELAYGLEGHVGDHLELYSDDLGPSAEGATDRRFAVEIRRPADKATLVRIIITFVPED